MQSFNIKDQVPLLNLKKFWNARKKRMPKRTQQNPGAIYYPPDAKLFLSRNLFFI